MRLTVNMEVSAVDQKLLAQTLGCKANELIGQLEKHAEAALQEYLECYLGRRALTRGSDILEHRLSLLIQRAFKNEIPSDVQVARLFQLTLSASRTLIRNTLSKYRYQLDEAEQITARLLLERATWPGGGGTDYHVRATSPNLIDLLNQRLNVEDPALKPVSRLPDSVGTYAINQYSYDKLCSAFGANKVARSR